MQGDRKKVFKAIVLLLSLMAPMAIGLGHSFHHHDKLVCQAESEYHIHEFELPCDDLHYFSQTPEIVNQELVVDYLPAVTDSSINEVKDLCGSTSYDQVLYRGPPMSFFE